MPFVLSYTAVSFLWISCPNACLRLSPQPHQRYRKIGPRILTFFLYLNDDGLTGGETDFPRLGLKVQPKAGRAVLWPSVLNDDPNANDPRSDHGALPVKDGVKYGANAWIHLRDVKNDDLDCL
jgi:prolyl 4-hydroxylase